MQEMCQYAGKSTQIFKRRHSGHKQEVKRCYGGLGQHYGGQHGCGYPNLKIQIVDQVEIGNDEALAECELFWAHQLRAYVENGGRHTASKKNLDSAEIWAKLGCGNSMKLFNMCSKLSLSMAICYCFILFVS